MSETLVRAVIISSDNLTMVKGSTELDINSKDLSKNRLLGHILITVDSISHFMLIVLHPITKRHCVLVKKFHNVPYRCCLIGHIFRTEFWLLIFVFCFYLFTNLSEQWLHVEVKACLRTHVACILTFQSVFTFHA
jgi:hypothetical protein